MIPPGGSDRVPPNPRPNQLPAAAIMSDGPSSDFPVLCPPCEGRAGWSLRTEFSGALCKGLFGLMKSRITGGIMTTLPVILRRRAAGYLSLRGYDAQAITLDPDPLNEPSLRAGLHTPFSRNTPVFSSCFTLWQGMAWLGQRRDLPPSPVMLAAWLTRLPARQRERAFAFIRQIRYDGIERLAPLLPASISLPGWFLDSAEQLLPSPQQGLNPVLLAFNRLKLSGQDQVGSDLLAAGFRKLGLQPPPADLFDGFSPPPMGSPARDPAFPTISVIVCAWNAAEFLPVALASLLSQTYPNLEIIAIDDGSSDGTHEVMNRWLGRDRSAVVLRNERNLGTYPCRNIGLERASGEYVMFHDADDWSEPGKVERQWLSIFRRRGVYASSSDWFRIDARTGLCFARRIYPLCRWNCSSFLFHREMAIAHLGFYDGVRSGGDSEYVARFEAVFGKHRHVRIRLPLSIGLEHGNSLTGDPRSGFDAGGLSAGRQAYLEAWRAWHAKGWNLRGQLRLAAGDRIPGHDPV